MSWLSRLKNTIRPQHLDAELADELRDHLERRIEHLESQGYPPHDARRRALQQFGNPARLQEQSRDYRLFAWLQNTLQDVRYALRVMRKNKAFSVTAIVSLALAIGANTAIYSIVDAALLRPLPLPHPEQLITLGFPEIADTGGRPERTNFSYPVLQRFKSAVAGSARLAMFSFISNAEIRIQNGSPVERAEMQYVSGDAFDIVGVPPAAGRLFSSEDDRKPGTPATVVLSYDYWTRRFARDPAILGSILTIGDRPFRIQGVAGPRFFGVQPGKFIDVWLPAMMYDHPEALNREGWNWFQIAGRLSGNTTGEQIEARLQPVFHDYHQRLIQQIPTMPENIRRQFLESRLRVHSAARGVSAFRNTFERPLWIVLGVAAAILLIACSNVATLLLARSAARASEIAMRLSLGAPRSRLVRQLLTESLLLSLPAGAIGWIIARASAPLLVERLSKQSDPVRLALALDTRVLLFCVLVSTAAAVLFGLLPAWQSSSAKPIAALRSDTVHAARMRLGSMFTTLEIAFAFCLVVLGSAFIFTLRHLQTTDPGFDPRNVVVLRLTGRLATPLQSSLQHAAGVEAVAAANLPVFGGAGWSEQILLPGKPPSDREEIFLPVSPGYFQTLKTPLLSGRDFNRADHFDSKPVPVIVNDALARRYFAGDAIGREFDRPAGPARIRHLIIGVAANAFYTDVRHGAEPIVYLPMPDDNAFTLYVRSRLPFGDLVKLVEQRAAALSPALRVREVTRLDDLVGASLLREKLLAITGGAFALLGLALASIGVFGILNYSVVSRTKEIGIRAALGALPAKIVALVTRDLMAPVAIGITGGLLASLAVLAAVHSLLFGIEPTDPGVIGFGAAVFLLASLAAIASPAYKAASIDPMRALRHE